MDVCQACGAPLLTRASTCPRCHEPTRAAVVDALEVPDFTGVALPSTPGAGRPLSAAAIARRTSQQDDLARLRQEIADLREQLRAQRQETAEGLAKKADKVELTPAEQPSLAPRQKVAMGILLGCAGALFLLCLALIILYSKPNHRTDTLALVSTVLVVAGGFYLAYDLLKNRLLLLLTVYITNALVGVLGALPAIILFIVQDMRVVPPNVVLRNLASAPGATISTPAVLVVVLFTRSALLCLFWGALIGMSGELLQRAYLQSRSRSSEIRRLARMTLYCLVFWIGLLGTLSLVLAGLGLDAPALLIRGLFLAIVLALATSILVGLYRRFIIGRFLASEQKRSWSRRTVHVFSTSLIFCLPALLGVLLSSNVPGASDIARPGAVGIAVGFILSGTLATLLAPVTFRLVNNLKKKHLGTIGLLLASLGTALAILPALIDLVTR